MDRMVENLLITHGYQKINSSLPEFSIYYMIVGSQAIVVHTVDAHPGLELTAPQYLHIKEQIITLFRNKGYADCKLFSLFLSTDIDKVKSICAGDSMSWILDTRYRRLIVYEGHVGDFYGLRKLLESISASEDSNIHQNGDVCRNDSEDTTHYYGDSMYFKNFAPVNVCLIIINIVVFLYLEMQGSTSDVFFMVDHGAMFPPLLEDVKQYYRLFTCMFLHFGLQHLASNMIALFFIGDNVERSLGKVKYLILYLLSGIGASSFSLMFAYIGGNDVVSAGASGAVFGVVGALLWMVIRNHGRLEEMTTLKVLIMIAYCLLSGFTSQGIDNAAHVGGLITGVLLAMLLYRKKEHNL